MPAEQPSASAASSPVLARLLASPFSPYWSAATTAGSNAARRHDPDDEPGGGATAGFSPFVGFCFTINYILGTGFLTIPWALAQGGWLLSTLVLIVVGLLSDASKNYLLEAMARAEHLLDAKLHWIDVAKQQAKAANAKKSSSLSRTGERARLVYSPIMVMTPGASTSQQDLVAAAAAGGMVHPLQQVHQSYDALESAAVTNGTSTFGNGITAETTTTPNNGMRRAMLVKRRSSAAVASHNHNSSHQLVVRPERKFEVNTLCRVFLGKTGLRLYTTFICLYIYCTLWAYTSVFSSAMAQTIPLRRPTWGQDTTTTTTTSHQENADFSYLVFALIFAALVVPLSCMELHEQVTMQVGLTLARFVMLALMLCTAESTAHHMRAYSASSSPEEEEENNGGGRIVPVPPIRIQGISSMVPIMVFAHIFHHSIPGLAHPIADKKALGPVFRVTVICCTVMYIWIAVVLASAFGQDIEQSSNLMWKHHIDPSTTTGDDSGGGTVSSFFLYKAISWYVVCFPALDVVSAFPLNAITLGNNLLGALYGRRTHEYENNATVRIFFRLLASVPPIVLGIFERQLGRITDYAGTTGFIIGFSFPALLWLSSRSMAQSKQASTTTFYTSYASHQGVAWFVLLFGICMALYVVVGLAHA